MLIKKCDRCGKIIDAHNPYFSIGEIEYNTGNGSENSMTLIEGDTTKEYKLNENWSEWTDLHFCPECFEKEKLYKYLSGMRKHEKHI